MLLLTIATAANAQSLGQGINYAIESARQYGVPFISFRQLITNIGNWLLDLVIFLSMLGIVIGGVMYIASIGDEKRAALAKRIITYAIIGLVIAFTHVLITKTVCNWLAIPDAGCPLQPLIGFQGIIANLGNFLLGLVAFLGMVAIIWGGITYITSFGDEKRAAQGKSIILYALIGILIAGIYELIYLAVCQVLGLEGCTEAGERLANLILNIVYIMLALVAPLALGAIVYGAYLYVTSGGDTERAARAKWVIVYTVAGIVIVIVSAMVVNIVINLLT